MMGALEEKERTIEELQTAATERLRLIKQLTAELRGKASQINDVRRAYAEMEQVAQDRLAVIERLDAEVRRAHAEMEQVAQERLSVIERLDAELRRQRNNLRNAEFVGRCAVSVVVELSRALAAAQARDIVEE